MNTELTVKDRAAVALGSSKAEAELIELASKSKAIVAITNKDGRTECHAAAMVAKEARVNIEKAGKAAREDATAFSKAVIAEESRLVGLIAPEERRLLNLRDDWDAKVKAEKEAAEAAERQRVASIKEKIDLIKRGPMNAAMMNADDAQSVLDLSVEIEIDDSYGEFYGEAVEAKAEVIAKLREIVAAKVSAEATAARIKAEQEAEAARLEIERQRLAAERAENDRIAAENRAAEAQRQAEERASLEAARAELARARKEIEEASAELLRKANEEAAEKIRKMDAERKAQEDQVRNERPDAYVEAAASMARDAASMPAETGATMKLGDICARLGVGLTREFIGGNLGVAPVARDRSAVLYRESDFEKICHELVRHINKVVNRPTKEAA